MAVYFFRNGQVVHTEYALPLNHLGEHRRRGLPTVYTAKRLREINMKQHVMTPSERALKEYKNSWETFLTEHRDTANHIDAWANEDSYLRDLQDLMNLEIALSEYQICLANMVISQLKKRKRY